MDIATPCRAAMYIFSFPTLCTPQEGQNTLLVHFAEK